MPTKQVKKQGFASLPHAILNNPQWAGQWRAQLGLSPATPLLLELACGKADFSLGWAQLRPEAAILAIDSKPNRLYDGAQRALAEGIGNVWFLREDILLLGNLFAPGEVNGIWITFPDPFPKARHARRRLTSPYYWPLYQQILAPGSSVQFKTDDPGLFHFTREVLAGLGWPLDAHTNDLYASDLATPETSLPTAYERRFRAEGKPIHYLCLRPPVPAAAPGKSALALANSDLFLTSERSPTEPA